MKASASAVLALGMLFSTGSPCNAQNFNRRFDLLDNGQTQTGFDIEVLPDSSYAVVLTSAEEDSLAPNLYFSYYSIGLMGIDQSGAKTFQQRYVYPMRGIFAGWSNCCDTLLGGGFIVGGTVQDTAGNLRLDLISFNQVWDTVWTHEYNLGNDNWNCQQVKNTPDGGFIMAGIKSLGASSIQGFAIKANSTGIEEWTRTYAGGGAIISVAPLADDGFLLAGNLSVGGNIQHWLVRVDSMGGLVWPAKIWGSAYDDNGLSQCLVATDGEIIIVGAMAYANDYDAMKPYIAKVDIDNAATLWEHVYGPERYATTAFSVKECPNTDLIACGVTSAENLDMIGFLLHTTANGDSLWMRDYYYVDSLMPDGQGRLYDVMPTPDGGYVATGAAYHSYTVGYPPGYSQDVWVLKVDSLGCVVPGCNGVTGITAQVTNLGEVLRLYPNPVQEQLHVGIHLPGTFATSGPLTLTVTSLEGKMVLQQQVPTSSLEDVVLNVSSLSSGMYSVHLSDATRWLAGKKFVVE